MKNFIIILAIMIFTFMAAKQASAQTNESDCSKTVSDKPIAIKWVNKAKTRIKVSWINFNCEEGEAQIVEPDATFEGTSYEGHVFKILIGYESDESSSETITVSPLTAKKNIIWRR